MRKLLVFATLLAMLGCGTGGDDSSTDNRICIVNDSFRDEAQLGEVELQAEEAGLDVEPGAAATGADSGLVSICGTTVQVDAIIGTDDPEQVAQFLATGRRL